MKSNLLRAFVLSWVLCLVHLFSSAQAPTCSWAQHAGGSGEYTNDARGTCIDQQGNILVTGFFRDSAITFGNTTLVNNGSYPNSDYYLVKYDPAGNVLWAISNGGPGDDFGESVTTDNAGNVYVVGAFRGAYINFDSTFANASGNGSGDMFIAKYDIQGNLLWGKSTGGGYEDHSFTVTTDYAGNAIVAGTYESTSIVFADDTLKNPNGGGYEKANIFVVKYSAAGHPLWSRNFGGTGNERLHSITHDTAGNLFISGEFRSPSIAFGSTTLTNANSSSYDLYVVKLDSGGSPVWAKGTGGAYFESGLGIATDLSGNILVTGFFASTSVVFGSTTLTNANTNGGADIFLVKYDNGGTVQWAQRAGGTLVDEAFSVATDAGGNAYIAGYFNNHLLTIGSTTLTNACVTDTSDIFMVKYDSHGNPLWAKSIWGNWNDVCNSISVTQSGTVYIAGTFISPVITFTSTFNNPGLSSMYLAKFDNVSAMTEVERSDETIIVFPNPFTDQTTLITPVSLIDATATLYNLNGQEVRTIKNITGRQVVLQRNNLPSGLYFIQLNDGTGIHRTSKLIVED